MPGFLSQIFGSKPTVPALKPIDIGQIQQQTITQNQAALPGAEKLATDVNTFNQQQLLALMAAATPDFAGIQKNIGENLASMTAGEIPQDVQDAIQRSAAARALGGGYGGSGMHGALVARDLGLTSLQLTQQGLASAEKWMSFTRSALVPEQFNVSSMFFTPQQQLGFATSERNTQFAHDWLQSQIQAMPDPVLSGINAEIMSLLQSYVGSLGGGGMKGGGGGGATDWGWGTAGYSDLQPMNFQNPSFSGD